VAWTRTRVPWAQSWNDEHVTCWHGACKLIDYPTGELEMGPTWSCLIPRMVTHTVLLFVKFILKEDGKSNKR
jgi:hypothetical protein